MSIPVPVASLDEALAAYSYAYLLTVSDDGRPHAVAVLPRLTDGVLHASIGHRSGVNASTRPDGVSLVWPPTTAGGYSLIIDGAAVVDGESISVTPSKAVLHRPAPPETGAVEDGACGSDCVSVSLG